MSNDPYAPEPLNPELRDHIYEGRFGQCIKHPLVISVPYFELLNKMLNEKLREKRAALHDALDKGKWASVIWLHERPYRVAAFWAIRKKMDDPTYWRLLQQVLIDTENQWQNKRRIRSLLTTKRRGSSHQMMDEEEQRAFDELPSLITIYRGCMSKNQRGFSWTLSRDRAVWFAKRFDRTGPRVVSALIAKRDVLALLLGRGEQEVLCVPEHANAFAVEQLKVKGA